MPDNKPVLRGNFYLEKEHQYFDGHFEHKKILPAVAQISLCMSHFEDQFDNAKLNLINARFYKEIIPGNFAITCDAHRESRLTFEFFDEDELCSRIVFSTSK